MAKILLIDDDKIILSMVGDFLEGKGHAIYSTTNPTDGLRILQKEDVDVVLLDIFMPHATGFDIIPKARQINNKVAIIMMTGHASVDSAIESIRAGAYDYIKKPVNLDELSQAVNRALERSELRTSNLELIENLQKRVSELELFSEISLSISSVIDLDQLLEHSMMIAKSTICADACSILLLDKDRGELVFNVALGDKADKLKEFRIKPGQGIAGWVLENKKSIIIDDVANDSRFFREPDEKSGFHTRNMIAVPLFYNNEMIGVIEVINKTGDKNFDEQDLSVITTLSTQIAVAIRNAQLVSELDDLFYGTIRALASAVDAKSPWTAGHSERVTRYALHIGREMGLSEKELKTLEIAGILHDVGKIGTDEKILDKPGKLTDEEHEIIKKHSPRGVELLKHIKHLEGIIPTVYHHHENFDGSGYPAKLAGESIPPLARILSAADSLDAMKADRPYRKGRTLDFVISEFKNGAGSQFDPVVTEVLLGLIDKGLITGDRELPKPNN